MQAMRPSLLENGRKETYSVNDKLTLWELSNLLLESHMTEFIGHLRDIEQMEMLAKLWKLFLSETNLN